MSKSSDLSDINKILEDYKNVTEEALEQAIKRTAEETVNDLRSAQPSGAGKYGSWSDYLRGWTATKPIKTKSNKKSIIYNLTHYRLAHLLEFGTRPHAMPNGGRHPGARPFEHIEPITKDIEDKFLQNLKEGLEQ